MDAPPAELMVRETRQLWRDLAKLSKQAVPTTLTGHRMAGIGTGTFHWFV